MRQSTKIILFMQFLMLIAIYFDIPIARQIVSFIYLSVIPGFVLLRVLKLKKVIVVDTVLFSVGLSIALLMFVGLLINELYPLLGISRQLSILPLTITISALTLGLLFVGYKRNLTSANHVNAKLGAISFHVLFFVLPPLLSIIGALYASVPILLLMIIIVAALYALSVFSNRLVPTKLYPIMIFAVSTALLFHMSLRSKYLMGYDVHREYYVFRSTEINGRWHSPGIGVYPSPNTMFVAVFNSVLSITILPTIFSLLLNIKGELIFKIIYPLIFCFVPLTLYRIYEKQTGKSVALVSALFFVSIHYAFYGAEMLSLARQMIGELFLVLSVLLLVDKEIAPQKRQVLFLIFGAALVVSHYTLSYIYLSCIVLVYVISLFSARMRNWSAQKTLNGKSVLFLIVMTCLWNMFVTNALSEALIYNVQKMYQMFTIDLFNPTARSSLVFSSKSVLNTVSARAVSIVNWMFFYVRHFFILVGVAALIVKARETKIDPDYRLASIWSMVIIFLCIVIPNFAPTINFTRFYGITLLFLAVFFTLGGKTVFGWMEKLGMFFPRKSGKGYHRNLKLRLVAAVLIASFLFEVGFVQHVTKVDPVSFSLDMSRMKSTDDIKIRLSLYMNYIPEQDVLCAKWLSEKMNRMPEIYADLISMDHVLVSYGLISTERIRLIFNTIELEQGAYVYLRHLNIVDGVIITYAKPFNTSEISFLLNESNKIYSNGASEILCALGRARA